MSDLTAQIGSRIGARGVEVHDIRAKMPRHKTERYDRLPNTDWQYTAVHYTAATRRESSLAVDIASWQGHANYHINNHGWPGIAYAIGASLSGRVFLLRDIEEAGYHAYGANYNSIGVSADMGVQAATPSLLRSLGAILGALHEDTPELANLIRSRTYGHKELGFLDPRNTSTGCPGSLLPWVQAYRAGHAEPAPDQINAAFDAYRAHRPWLGTPQWRGQISERAHWGGGDPLDVLWMTDAVLGWIDGKVVPVTSWALTEGEAALGSLVHKF